MAIEMGKKYKLLDIPVRVRYTDGKQAGYPVCCEDDWGAVYLFTADGVWRTDNTKRLVEISPYSDIAIDAPGWARYGAEEFWTPLHFAGVNRGRPTCWRYGKTSHTANGDFDIWGEFTTTKPEGL